jgi:hypothetical protein
MEWFKLKSEFKPQYCKQTNNVSIYGAITMKPPVQLMNANKSV